MNDLVVIYLMFTGIIGLLCLVGISSLTSDVNNIRLGYQHRQEAEQARMVVARILFCLPLWPVLAVGTVVYITYLGIRALWRMAKFSEMWKVST